MPINSGKRRRIALPAQSTDFRFAGTFISTPSIPYEEGVGVMPVPSAPTTTPWSTTISSESVRSGRRLEGARRSRQATIRPHADAKR
jgi:hypothetical protein